MTPSSPDEFNSITVQCRAFGMSAKVVLDYQDELLRNFTIYMAKTGSTMHGLFLIISKMTSTVLRREKKLDKVVERLKEIEPFAPDGFCSIGEEQHFKCSSYAEFLIKLLERYWNFDGEKFKVQGTEPKK